MNRTIAVIGQCRTGTSMTMQMLVAAGLVVAGEAPGHEDDRVFGGGEDGWWSEYDAIKFVDPHTGKSWFNTVRFPRVIVCRRRNTREQAKSISKFTQDFVGMYVPPKGYLGQIIGAKRWYNSLKSASMLHLVFEDTITNPSLAAQRIVDFVGCGDVDTVASVVVDRGPSCYKGMLEKRLVEKTLTLIQGGKS